MLSHPILANPSVKGDHPYKSPLVPEAPASIHPQICIKLRKNAIIDNQSLTIQKSPSEQEK